jgi:hypothetical protein
MTRRMAKAIAAWEDDGGARRAPYSASAVRSRNREVKPGDRIVPEKYLRARLTTVSGEEKL